MNHREYNKQKDDIHFKIKNMPYDLDGINRIISQIRSTEIRNPSLKKSANEQIKVVEDKLFPKNSQLSRIIDEITEKERQLFDSFSKDYA